LLKHEKVRIEPNPSFLMISFLDSGNVDKASRNILVYSEFCRWKYIQIRNYSLAKLKYRRIKMRKQRMIINRKQKYLIFLVTFRWDIGAKYFLTLPFFIISCFLLRKIRWQWLTKISCLQ
jgi:hypothetical protein